MLDIYDMRTAISALEDARRIEYRALEARQSAWRAYMLAREHWVSAEATRETAERNVLREAGRLSSQPARPNRDERRAQVLAGLLSDDLPF
jgi:hypothetical protein